MRVIWHRFSRDWAGETAVVVGNGTSMIGLDLSPVRRSGARVLVTNGGFDLYPEADQLMLSDRHYIATRPALERFKGPQIVVTQPQAVVDRDLRMVFCQRAFIEATRGDIFANPALLVEGHNSVTTNIAAAVHRGVKRIVLLGVDLHPGAGGRRRATDETLDDLQLAKRRYAKMARHLAMQAPFLAARGIKVINCTPGSRLECYPKAELEKTLC